MWSTWRCVCKISRVGDDILLVVFLAVQMYIYSCVEITPLYLGID